MVSLSTIAKQLNHPSTEGWITKLFCIYTMEFDPSIKKNETMEVCRRLNRIGRYCMEVTRVQKDKHHMLSPMHVLVSKGNHYGPGTRERILRKGRKISFKEGGWQDHTRTHDMKVERGRTGVRA